jgi:predicted N-acetyltransferase YhbS
MNVALQPVTQALPSDRPEIEALLDAAFGADRQLKTTYRLRENNARADDLSRVVRQADDHHLCGSIEFWPVVLTDAGTGTVSNAVLLGPIAVSESCRGQGVGGALMQSGIAAAREAGHDTIILVGDPEFYGRFGFSNDRTGNWLLPGPVEQRRVLVLSDRADLPGRALIQKSFALEEPHGRRHTRAQQ